MDNGFHDIMMAWSEDTVSRDIYTMIYDWLTFYKSEIRAKDEVDDIIWRMDQGEEVKLIVEDFVTGERYAKLRKQFSKQMAAALTIPEFLARSQALEASLRAVLPEYTLLHGQYENIRNEALPENNPVPGGAGEVNMVAADLFKAQVDDAFAGVMDVIQEICAVNNPVNNGNENGNNMGGGRKRRKRRSRKTRRTRK